MANPVQYIILNNSVEMSHGKAAAQAAHASVLGFHYSLNGHDEAQNKLTLRWLQSGHYAKVVLGADDLFVAERYIKDRRHNLFSQMVIDEGRTEFSATHTPTALGFEIVDKDWPWVADVFGNFKLYKAPEKEPELVVLTGPCDLPPKGWRCGRPYGHAGPCTPTRTKRWYQR